MKVEDAKKMACPLVDRICIADGCMAWKEEAGGIPHLGWDAHQWDQVWRFLREAGAEPPIIGDKYIWAANEAKKRGFEPEPSPPAGRCGMIG